MQVSEVRKRIPMDSFGKVFRKMHFQKLVHIRLSFCLWTQCKPLLSQPLSFPTVFADFQVAFCMSNLPLQRENNAAKLAAVAWKLGYIASVL